MRQGDGEGEGRDEKSSEPGSEQVKGDRRCFSQYRDEKLVKISLSTSTSPCSGDLCVVTFR